MCGPRPAYGLFKGAPLVVTKRSPLAVVVLTVVTFGLYAYWWLYRTTKELQRETDRDDLRPLLDVLLAVVTVGLWGIWAGYRNSKIVHEEMLERGEEHLDRSMAVGVISALSLATGWAWVVAMAILQEDLNRLAETDFVFAPAAPFEGARQPAVRARVETADPVEAQVDEQVDEHAWEPPHASSRGVEVWTSTAPAPVVY